MNTLISIGLVTIGLSVGLPIFLLLMFLVVVAAYFIFAGGMLVFIEIVKWFKRLVEKHQKKIKGFAISIFGILVLISFVSLITYFFG